MIGMEVSINIASDFTPFPGGRVPAHGEFNGQTFRINHLEPPLRKGNQLLVIFDGLAGLPSSFLEEAFGGLVRDGLITSIKDYKEKIRIEAKSPTVKNAPNMIERYVKAALKEVK